MPKLSPKSIAYDRANDRAVLYATHGKDKYLLALDQKMGVRILRKVNAPSETFWIAGDRAVFWAIEKSAIVPLADEKAKAKTIKHEDIELETAFVPEPTELYALMGESVVRFENDAWTKATFDGRVVHARLDGVYVDGKKVHEHRAVRASISASGTRCLIGVHGGKHVLIDGDAVSSVEHDHTIWCSIGFERGFFAWSNYRIYEVGFDGSVKDTGITKDQEAADTCLFCTGNTVYFIQRSTIHRHVGGKWTRHDMAAAGEAIGLR